MRYAKFGIWFLILSVLLRIADFTAGWLWSSDPTVSTVSLYSISYYAPYWLGILVFFAAALMALRREWRPGIGALFLLSLVLTALSVVGLSSSLSLLWEWLAKPAQTEKTQFRFEPSLYFILETAWSGVLTCAEMAVTGGTAHILFFAKRKP